ncbi:tyrosine integrase [Mycobacterium phage Nairb]|uniref:Integrase n=4 Tax=Bernalvirus bernal13 TaxID=1982102 RepID=A0A2P1JRR5_9CAUD|nr:endonuclease [Mycobacterium phage Bernal13]AHY26949.1 tyrosine integrase [Mycobacterium phage Bernal13]AVO21821.1 tyrosine integrase [Mycobacterium phage Nairb]QBP28878.1 tyrosine integrase [Mycobacterium phage Ibrahim]QHB47439.1 tyrosine integrase [Mycobacterium phage Whitty]
MCTVTSRNCVQLNRRSNVANRKRRSPGDGGLFKRADGMWTGSVEVPTADGSRKQKRVYSKDFRTAKAKLDALKADIDRGVIPTTHTTTVAKWLDHWLTEVKKPHVSPNTYDFYEEAVRLHIVPIIGARQLGRLTAQEIRGVLNQANTSRNAQRAYMVLNQALAQAVADGVLRRNVCDAVTKPGHTAKQRDSLALADAVHIIRTAIRVQEESTDPAAPRLATRWIAAFMLGGRPSELRGLEIERVDLDRMQLDLSWQLQQLKRVHGCLYDDGRPTCGKTRVGYCPRAKWDIPAGREYRECYRSMVWTRPKTKAGQRIVPLPMPLADMLAMHIEATAGDPNPHGLVWRHRDGRPIMPTDENELWHALVSAAELPQVEQYATRHTTATLLESLDVPADVRMQIMGQSSAVAHRAYVHVDQSRTRPALNRLAELLA